MSCIFWSPPNFSGICFLLFRRNSHSLKYKSCVLATLKREKRLPQQPEEEITHKPIFMTSNLTMMKKIGAFGRHKLIEGLTVLGRALQNHLDSFRRRFNEVSEIFLTLWLMLAASRCRCRCVCHTALTQVAGSSAYQWPEGSQTHIQGVCQVAE